MPVMTDSAPGQAPVAASSKSVASSNTVWDERFSGAGYLYGVEPNAFLVRQRHRLKPGTRVLAVADGEGRNGVWLAQQGMRVTSVDGSAVAVRKALKLAMTRGVSIRAEVAELIGWRWTGPPVDAVAAIFIHFPPETRPRVHRAMAEALAPDGLLILEAFHKDQLGRGTGGPPRKDMLYDAAMLREDFEAAGLEILEIAEGETDLDEGPSHRGSAMTIRMVARRSSH